MVLYVFLIIQITRENFLSFSREQSEELTHLEEQFLDLKRRKQTLFMEKQQLEALADNLLTLFELTKDVAKTTTQEDALKIFKERLQENVTFEKFQWCEPLSSNIPDKVVENELVLFLNSQKRKLGILILSGIQDTDKEKVMILGNQFAFGLLRIQLYQELEKTAITDSLTELYTRRYLMERFDEELNRSKMREMSLSFLMIDVDNFKRFNDQYGHLTGDQILRQIAKIIKENIREIDIAGRFGGEEFCIVLPDTNKEGAVYVAERIRSTTEKTIIKAYDASVNATISIGVATSPKDGRSIDTLLENADFALYQAKASGRNKVCAAKG